MGSLYNAGKDAAVTSLILPAFNPGPAVERTWDTVRRFLQARPDPWEVLFVLDGCTDGTRERLGALARRDGDSRMRVVSYFPNRGKGYAVRTGLLAARGDWRLFTDVDLAYRFEDIARTADELRHGAEVAIASREHPESTIQLPPATLGYAYRRRLQSYVFGTLARTLLPLTQLDTQAGLKGVTARVAEQLVPNLNCDGFGFDCELLAACARYGIHVQEVPVSVRYEDAASTTGLRTTLRMVRELWSIRRPLAPQRLPRPGGRPGPPRPARPRVRSGRRPRRRRRNSLPPGCPRGRASFDHRGRLRHRPGDQPRDSRPGPPAGHSPRPCCSSPPPTPPRGWRCGARQAGRSNSAGTPA